MKKVFLSVFLVLLFVSVSARSVYEGCGFEEPVKSLYTSIPKDLKTSVLLVPQYDIVPGDVPNAALINRSAKEGNAEIIRILKKSYSGKYKTVSLKEVEKKKQEGNRYFMDMVVMPKQMKEPKKEAMISSYRKFKTANAMFANYDAQFHYYFYIRDLKTDDAYLTEKFHGRFQAYQSMEEFLKRVNTEL
ncbi:MAG: hypothetical protein K1X92_11245 [Bacteroidia bacterium]|nr:hypothetical protein [Bacteroidia bacterium]